LLSAFGSPGLDTSVVELVETSLDHH